MQVPSRILFVFIVLSQAAWGLEGPEGRSKQDDFAKPVVAWLIGRGNRLPPGLAVACIGVAAAGRWATKLCRFLWGLLGACGGWVLGGCRDLCVVVAIVAGGLPMYGNGQMTLGAGWG